MNFFKKSSSDNIDQKINEMKEELQKKKQDGDVNNLKKLSDKVDKDLWKLNEKLRRTKEDIIFEKSKIDNVMYDITSLENSFDGMVSGKRANIHNSMDELKYYSSGYDRKISDLYSRLVENFNRFVNSKYGTLDSRDKRHLTTISEEGSDKHYPKDFSVRSNRR